MGNKIADDNVTNTKFDGKSKQNTNRKKQPTPDNCNSYIFTYVKSFDLKSKW